MFNTYRNYFISIITLSLLLTANAYADYPTYWISRQPFKQNGGGAIKLIKDGSVFNISIYANRGAPSFDQNSMSINLSVTKEKGKYKSFYKHIYEGGGECYLKFIFDNNFIYVNQPAILTPRLVNLNDCDGNAFFDGIYKKTYKKQVQKEFNNVMHQSRASSGNRR